MTDTRKQLLAATRACIATNGLAATTSRQITAAARANLAAITYHFGSKEGLVAAALLDALHEWLAPAIEALVSGGDSASRALVAIQALTETFEAHRDEAPAYVEALVQAQRIAPLGDGFAELLADLRQLLSTDIAEMQGRGELAGWIIPDTMASVLLAVANGLVMQAVIDPDGPPMAAMTSQFGALLLAARRGPA